jgi:hypothetical protein
MPVMQDCCLRTSSLTIYSPFRQAAAGGSFLTASFVCVVHSFCPLHYLINLSLELNMPEVPAEDVVDRLSLDHPCPIGDGYYLPVKDVTLAIIYSSSRLLAMHRAIKKPEVGTLPQYPAAFYKNLCWEVDVSPVNNPCMPSIDRLARPSSPLGSCNWLAPSLSDITIMLWT